MYVLRLGDHPRHRHRRVRCGEPLREPALGGDELHPLGVQAERCDGERIPGRIGQRRAAVATHRAIPLARVVRDVRQATAGAEVVSARLCYHGDELVYVLTVLTRDGKVFRVSVNAASGVLIDGH